ncbi:MAG TPA: hypothetical protein VE575_11315 [Acidimicrobiales bacterium]|jgi:hypothetical protein|nr:hypothetical protein [Acidimicrobiales bacterium]
MSPVARSQGHTGRALLVAGAGVVLALGIAFGMAALANRGTVDVRLGSETFAEQDAEEAAERVAEDGPILYADTAGGERDIVLQHLGDDPEEGWVALAARPPGVPRECTIQWDADDQMFQLLDPDGDVSGQCDGREFPADGEGLPSFPVTVRSDGRLDVDLNAADRATSTTR